MLLHALLQLVALQGGTVHPMTPGDAPRVATVLLRDGLIEAVGPELEVPDGARVLDVSGLHVTPGLIDGMVHHDLDHDPLYVLAGVTLVRDMGNDIERVLAAREPGVRDAGPGPALLVCGAVLDGLPPATTQSVVLRDASEAEDKVPRLIELGVDFLAGHLGIPLDAWRRSIELGREEGLDYWGPLPRGAGFDDLLAAAPAGLTYVEAFVPEGAAWSDAEPFATSERVRRFAASGMALTPLLRVYAQRLEDAGDDARVLELLSPFYVAQWRRELEARRARLDEATVRAGVRAVERQAALLRELWEAGVPLVPGSGAPNPWLPPGSGLHDELHLWAAAGIPPGEVLRLATRGAAETLGLAGVRGSIAPGLVADLVCVEGDPSRDVEALRAPRLVVLRGRVLDRRALADLREGVLRRQARLQAEANRALVVPAPELPEGALLLSGLAETRAAGAVVSSERFAVVRLEDGALAFCSRLVNAPGLGPAPQEVRLEQVARGGRVERFELRVETGGHELVVKGLQVGGKLRVERRVDGAFVDNNSLPGSIALVDSASVTGPMLLAHGARPGTVPVLYFDGSEPALSRWEYALREGVHAARTALGPLAATFHPDGSLDELERVQGNGTVVTRVLEHSASGPGLPSPPAPEGGPATADSESGEAPADGAGGR